MNKGNTKNNFKAPKIVFIIFLFFILILFVQYCYISLFPSVYGITMNQFAEKRNTYSETLYASRGTIFDKDGNQLALNIASYTVIAYLSESRTSDPNNPKHVVDKELTATKLTEALGSTKEYILKQLNTENVYQVEFGSKGRGLTELKKDEIKELNLPGIDFIPTTKRYYPNGDFASYIIGYAKENEHYEEVDDKTTLVRTIDGELGIESKYNEILKGINGSLKYQQDRFGYQIPETKEERTNPVNGQDVYLTLDSNIQRFVESAIRDNTEKYKPEWMMIHVMDAKTGDILGSATTPSYDPNLRDLINYENSLVSFNYEPGSVMKTFTYMCAINKGTYRGGDTLYSGKITVGDSIINDWNSGQGWGTISFDKGYEYSSNVAIANIVQKFIDKNDLKNCLTSYGFGLKTDIELPRELTGSLNFNYPVEVAAAGYGQGIFVTPIQILQGLSIIASNGKMITPHIIDKIIDTNTNKTVYQKEIKKSEQIVSEATVEKMKELMWNTVNATNVGTTGTGYKIEGFDIIGKTGTAQFFENGRYATGWNDYIYSFSGMYPKDNPEIIVYVAIKRPNNGSSSSIKDVTRTLMSNIAKYRNMYSEIENKEALKSHKIESYISKNTTSVKEKIKSQNITPIIIGNGDKITKQFPQSGTTLMENDKIYLITNDKQIKMPDLTGWSKSEASSLLNLLDISYSFNGYGYIKTQSIKKDELITPEMTVEFTLENKYNIDTSTP